MRTNNIKGILNAATRVLGLLLFGAVVAFGQQQVNLTAGAANATLPDGTVVPMWGYSCGAAVALSTATCVPLNPTAAIAGGWSPVVITVPTGQGLTINLTNNLSFAGGNIPTSIVIVGQLGGGLGTVGAGCTAGTTCTLPPDHTNAQPVTWPIAGDAPGAGLTGVGTPPVQGNRVQSFGTEVVVGTPGSLTWTSLRPGTYLIESGTHPSIQGPMGLFGILVVTQAPTTTPAARGLAYPAVNYDAEVPLLFSEIDPVQNNSVNTAVNTSGFSETMVWSGLPGGCGNPSSASYNQCYPPAVNYTPLYYMINGVAFDKTHASTSLFAAAPGSAVSPVTGTVLVRMVNAGLRMHVPSIVGSQTGVAVAPALPPGGFSLIAEDGNPLPGVARVQSEIFMPAGKTNDVMINVPTTALPVFDRELSLSSNATSRDGGMLAYIGVNGALLPATGAFSAAAAVVSDTYNSLIAGQTLTVSDPSKGVIANDTNVYGVQLDAANPALNGTVILNANGTFTYVPSGTATTDSFGYCANGTTAASLAPLCTTVTLGAAALELRSGITMNNISFTSNGTTLGIKPPGILAVDSDGRHFPLTVAPGTVAPSAGLTVAVDPNGGFNASVSAAGTYSFTYNAQNSQGVVSATTATVTITFTVPSGLAVTVLDGTDKTTTIADYRWVIEEDRTFYVDPNCTTNTTAAQAGCPSQTSTGGVPPTFGVNFHTSYMPLVATGCTGPLSCEGGQTAVDPATGLRGAVVCDIGNGVCRPDPTGSATTPGNGETPVLPSAVHLDPTKRYYISVLPGDAANPFAGANGSAPANCASGPYNPSDPTGLNTSCGHGMGGAPIAAGQLAVTVFVQETPFPPSKLSVFVFRDDFPLNGEHDSSGGNGVSVNTNNEPGLGGFNITMFDDAGGTGDATGQMTYDMFNQPLVNSLAGTVDPTTGFDACPISTNPRQGLALDTLGNPIPGVPDATQTGITGTIVTCPEFEGDRTTPSPLAGQAVIANLMPGRYGVVATPGADRIAKGEEWLQTNTLDGQKAHDSFLRIGEPSFFQEYGPAGYHVSIGFANPAIINSRLAGVCAGTDINFTGTNCTNTVTGRVTTLRMSRPPDERLYGSGDNSSFAFTQCYVSFGDPDGEDFAFTKCDPSNGTFTLTGLPDGDWRVTVFDQWNDMLVDGLSTPVRLSHTNANSGNLGDIATNQWQTNIYTTTFFDQNGNGVPDGETGLTLVATNIRFRDGSYSNFNNTDLAGNAGFNEIFPLFSWYVVETDSTRYKSTGTHVVYDAGGPSDGNCSASTVPCGTSTSYQNMANTAEQVQLPAALRVPGARYCASADCPTGDTGGGSTGRVDPPWVLSEGYQGFSGQNNFIDFGKKPFAVGENGGIHGEVIYASTRPFDDPSLLIHTSWTPDVPGVTINLYQEGTDPSTQAKTLRLVDTTKTSSWDDWAQGFRSDGNPNMNCPGQFPAPTTTTPGDLFFFSLFNQPNYLDFYNAQHGGPAVTALPNNSQYKCYDGMHNWNQIQPAPYDGAYSFPSVTGRDPNSGHTTGTNCAICIKNTDPTDTFRFGQEDMLPAGKYVVEMVVPPGYELVKEEDKNILIGDNYIAPVTQEFGGLGNIFIMPDQAAIGATFNANNFQQPTQDLGRPTFPQGEGDTGSVEQFWPCVGASRIVPDYISLFPKSAEVSPFAGATRNLCDRKEITLEDQMSVLAKFWVFTSTHVAAHFTGVITDDYTSEFDPFSPQFGEKFSPANLPISIKDWKGTETARVYSDHWGAYDGITYSTWEVNPPNPTGYGPTMMVTCMNDPGTGPTPDPLFNPQYSQFCYEIPFMPGQTQYMDTPVVPTTAYAGAGYNNVDCAYPDLTPAISEVDSSDGVGPWVSAAGAGHTLTIHALGDQAVQNYGYSGPSAATAPYNAKTVIRHYGFGTSGTVAIVGSDGVTHPLTGVSWSDMTITGTVPTGVPTCTVQQQQQYGGPTGAGAARCGELVITRGDNRKQSIDAVTVTIGGKAPVHVAALASIQTAIDGAQPGDLIIIDPTCTAGGLAVACTTAGATHSQAAHSEILIMWKPVRLQGVGAASTIINANTHPAGALKLDDWRNRVNCLFGLALNGTAMTGSVSFDPTTGNVIPGSGGANPFDPTGAATCGSKPGDTWTNFNPYGATGDFNPQVDRLPLEATIGWSNELNGNLAEMLQEPSLMGALEGAGITVLSKGVKFPSNPFDPGLLAGFPTGTTLLTSSPSDCGSGDGTSNPNRFPSNFQCNPSSIDGLGITDSSQGGGGIFVHGWGHNLQIANNRVYNNAGTLSGGINLGQGEFAGAIIKGATNPPPYEILPGQTSGNFCARVNVVTNAEVPYCFNVNVNMHHNYISANSSTGDELFSATPAGAGAASICTGADYYLFDYNWVCGNLSTGDGGGVGHLGFSYNGDIEHNSILFNQSTNPTIQANGGGMIVMGTPDQDIICNNQTTIDQDCTPIGHSITSVTITNGGSHYAVGNTLNFAGGGGLGATATVTAVSGTGTILAVNLASGGAGYNAPVAVTFNTSGGSGASATATLGTAITVQGGVGPSDGIGPGLVINANLIMGNTAESGSGGGIAFQSVNGADVIAFPTSPANWYSVLVTNNIIDNNVAGWDGGAISLIDSFAVDIINNTLASNNTTASAGPLFNTLGAPLSSTPPPPSLTCSASCGTTTLPQVAGLVAIQNSAVLDASFPTTITCPVGHGPGGTGFTGRNNGACRRFSFPKLENDVFWDNSAYYIGVGSLGTGTLNQQNVVALYTAFTTAQAPSQPQGDATTPHGAGVTITGGTGACVSPVSYWDIGVRGDTGPTDHAGSTTPTRLAPSDSVLTSLAGGYNNSGNLAGDPHFVSQYCNGSRVPPEFGSAGWQVPPGIADATVPNPRFDLTPTATVDEGNNWVNMSWGPLSSTNPTVSANGHFGGGAPLGNYGPADGTSSVDSAVSCTFPGGNTNFNDAPLADFYGTQRKTGNCNFAQNGNSLDAGAVEFVPGGGGGGPAFSLSPSSLAFGNQPDRTVSAARLVTMTNTGTTALTGISITFTGTNPLVFRQTNNCLPSVAVGASCTISVTFQPGLNGSSTLVGPKSANLRVITTGTAAQLVPLTGNTLVATAGFSAPSPSLLTGTTTVHSGMVTLTNTATGANAGPLTLTAAPTVVKVGAAGGTFAVIAGGTCASGTVLAPGGTCTVNVQYTPSGTTTATAHVQIATTGTTASPINGPNFTAN